MKETLFFYLMLALIFFFLYTIVHGGPNKGDEHDTDTDTDTSAISA